jgi:dTDP-4-amino-4,6-dideoxygalactose transaminase
MFDAAHALGCAWRGRMIGGFGDAEVISFHATKVANAFEGGAVLTDSDETASRVRLLRNYGFTDEEAVRCEGTNAKMHEASAAMGLTSLDNLDEFVAVNRRNHAVYREALADLRGLQVVAFDEHQPHNHHYLVLELNRAEAGIGSDVMQRVLRAENILARRYFHGCHRMEPYRTSVPDAGRRLPATEGLAARVLQLPTGTAVGVEDIEQVCAIVRFTLGHAAEVVERAPAVRL